MHRRHSDSSSTGIAGTIRLFKTGIVAHAFATIALALVAVDVAATGTGTTTVTLSSSPNPSQAGQSVHLGIIVSESGSGTYETGTVTVSESFDGDAPDVDVCPNLALNGSSGVKTAGCDLVVAHPDVHTYVAKYSGDANYAPQNSAVVSQIVEGVALTIVTPAIEYSQDFSVEGVVTGNNPTGTVTFSDVDSLQTVCTAPIATTVANSKNVQCNSTALTPGTHRIGAAYQGDGNNPGSVSNNGTVTVSKAVSHTSLTAPVSGSVAAGQNIHFVARLTVDPNVSLAPAGTVKFIDGGPDGSIANVLCQATATRESPASATIMTASCDAAMSTAGSRHLIGTSFQPDSPYMAPSGSNENVTLTVLANSGLTLTSSANPAVWQQDILLTATLSGASAPTGTVKFLMNGAPIGTMGQICPAQPLSAAGSTYQATCNVTGTALTGTSSFTAQYSGDAGNAAVTSSALIQVVNKASLAFQITPATANVALGSATTVTITWNLVAPAEGGGGFISGSLTLDDGSAYCSPISLPPNPPSVTATCTLTPTSPGTKTLTARYSGDANWNPATATAALTVSIPPGQVNLNQFGLSGAWENTATSGQGIVLSMFPDQTGPGQGILAAGWFTYDVAPSGGPEKQRWYALQGPIDNVHRVASLGIYQGDGGNFNATPKIPPTQIGSATLQFSDCTHGTLTYSFNDGSGRSGTIPLSRLDANVTCSLAGDDGSPAPAYQLSGAWYNPATSGQGFFAIVNPVQHLLFAAWYTYMPDGAASGSAAQRWYILQIGPDAYTPGTSPVSSIPIYTGTGGVFNDPAPHLTTQVGTATLTFIDCGRARIDYHFTQGTNAGLSGSVDLSKLGAIPAQCGLSP